MTLAFFRREPEIDSDIALITDYLAESLSPEGMESVRQRLAEDEAFFDKVIPLMQMWHGQVPEIVVRAAAAREHDEAVPESVEPWETPWWTLVLRRLNSWWRPALIGFSIPILMLAIKNGDPAMRQPSGSAIRPPIISRGDITDDMMGGAVPLPFDADAMVDIAPGRTLRLTTWPDPVFLEPGRYAIKCNLECWVGVERGRVHVISRDGVERYYGPGQTVQVPRDGSTALQ